MSSRRPQPTRSTSGPDPKVIGGVVAGVLVLVIASVAFIASGDDAGDVDTASQYGIITVQGDPLLPAGDAEDPAVGAVAPSVVSERAVGQVRLEPEVDAEPTMVVFLAHWCPVCQAELPVLVDLAEEGALDAVRTVAVLTGTTDTRPNFPPSAWLDEEGWTGDRLFDDEESTAAAAYGLTSYPFMVFLDEDGRVVERLSGEQPAAVIEAAVDSITT